MTSGDTRPRVLFLSQCLPHPPHSGVTNRTFNILRQLAREFDVTLLAFSRRNHQAGEEERKQARLALAELLSHVGEPVPFASERSRPRRLVQHLRSLLAGQPFTYHEYGSDRFGSQIDDVVARQRFDLVHLDSLDLHHWLPRLPRGVPVTCTHHDIDSLLLSRRAARTGSPLVAAYLRLQSRRIARLEGRHCADFALNLMMSDRDVTRLQEHAPGSKTLVVPNGVDTELFAPVPEPGAQAAEVVFVGPTYMFANRDAVDFFLQEVWPRVLEARADARLKLIGKSPESDRNRHAVHPAVECLGYVPDVRPYLARATCVIVPIRVGGGTRLKILDAWAMGKAVVSTSVGCEGLTVSDGTNILVRDRPEDFAAGVLATFEDATLRGRLETEGRRLAESTYSWDVIGQGLRQHYRRLTPGRAPSPSKSSERRPMHDD